MFYTSFVVTISVPHVGCCLCLTTTTCNRGNHKVACYSQQGHHAITAWQTDVECNPMHYNWWFFLMSLMLQVCITPAVIMITPAFDLSQDPEYLILSIRVPYTRTSEFDLYIDGTDFKFYAKPYFLRWVNKNTHKTSLDERRGWWKTLIHGVSQ